MKHLTATLVIFISLLIFSACASVKKRTELTLIDDYCSDRLEVSIAEFINQDGSMGVQATIKNVSDEEVLFQYRYQWFTENGRFVDSPTASWIPISLDPNDSYEALGAQVSSKTVRTKLSIKRQ